MPAKTGVLLINLGTPDAPRPKEVRRYLRQFLSDPRVIDINPLGRWLLLNLIILPFRPRQSAEAYSKIWTERGSPLLSHTEDLGAGVARVLGDSYSVAIGMRYGKPSIASALESLLAQDIGTLAVLPLFPQYSSAANGSAMEHFFEVLKGRWNLPRLSVREAFCDHARFVEASVSVYEETLAGFDADYVLFSYHGLPERQVQKSESQDGVCDMQGPCPALGPGNRYCYRAQCYRSTQAIALGLGLEPERYGVSFQSRLGRTPWVKPYTDHVLPQLAQKGIKRLAMTSPSFVADCLETLEELGIRAREQWEQLGGEDFRLLPCLNASEPWIEAVAAMIREQVSDV